MLPVLTTLVCLLFLPNTIATQQQRQYPRHHHHPQPTTSCSPPPDSDVTPIPDPNGFPPGYTFKPTATATRPLGGPIRPTTATTTYKPLDWSTVIVPSFPSAPVDSPAHTNTTCAESTNSTINKRCQDAGNPERPPPPPQTRSVLATRENPPSVDWRNRWGWPFLTSTQSQKGCSSCWDMAATALIESMVRIEHGIWSKRSEADLHDQLGAACGTLGGPEGAIDWIAGHDERGIADPYCYEWTGGERMYYPCADRSGRTVRLDASYTPVPTVDDQKKWLDTIGPLAACFTFYPDFYNWNFGGNSPYDWDGVTNATGGHCVLIVGYDDAVGGWLFKNSWDTTFGNNGYGWFKYGVAGIDAYAKAGLTNTNPDPWSKKSHHNGILYESGNGAWHRNFELIRSNSTGSLTQLWRQGEPPYKWSLADPGPELIALTQDANQNTIPVPGQTVLGQPVLIGSSFNRDFEVVYVNTDGYLVSWHYAQSTGGWFFLGQSQFGNLTGYPGFTQLDSSSFSVVVRTNIGSLQEYIRDAKTGLWSVGNTVARPGLIAGSGPSLVSTNIQLNIYDQSTSGVLFVVAVLNTGEMQLFYRPTSPLVGNARWRPTEIFGRNVAANSPPVMIQDYWRTVDETTPSGFQLLVAVNGRVEHWERINTYINVRPPRWGGNEWNHVWTFGYNVKAVWGLVQGSFRGELDAIVEDFRGDMWHWSFQGTPGFWYNLGKLPGVKGGW